MSSILKHRGLEKEMEIVASRSSGPGGQHVNKVNTKITLRFNITKSLLLTEAEKQTLLQRLKAQLSTQNELIINCQQSRSQIQNKLRAIEQLYTILQNALRPIKQRRKTKRTKSSIEKRLNTKKIQSLKKASRRLKDF
ncbi:MULTISPECIES: alternative ribosome rescue aminoacyl-tRNA hydrolase ArfB [unclassified Carboxylicivirga]|uniref:alternative ribosome rescue aminoacyl-tRNA hydrolase ArfB n=1 Tax=Carboxylicivirga TaxID=1628153 RepID=UPI003D33E133